MKTQQNPRTWLSPLALSLGLCCALCMSGAHARAARAEPVALHSLPHASSLVYVSDYVSFVGGDTKGRVAFALDNNRGRDGETWQAEHFVVLHQEGEGWGDIKGNGAYENQTQDLQAIPNSPFFQFRGAPEAGLTITSQANRLVLRVDPIPKIISRTKGAACFWMGSAPALLEGAGRMIEGRVIYEYLFLPDFNRLTRTYVGLWKEFQGFYALVEGEGDLYLHSQQSEQLRPLIGTTDGFVVLSKQPERLQRVELAILDRTQALGFYRWPTQWRVQWKGAMGPYRLEGSLTDRKVFANWLSGGFAMGIIQGHIQVNGRTLSVYGLAELLM